VSLTLFLSLAFLPRRRYYYFSPRRILTQRREREISHVLSSFFFFFFYQRPGAPNNESSLSHPSGEKMLADASFHTRVASIAYARARNHARRVAAPRERCLGENEALSEGFLQLQLPLPVVIGNSTSLENRREREREREREKWSFFPSLHLRSTLCDFFFTSLRFSRIGASLFITFHSRITVLLSVSRKRPAIREIRAIHKYSIRDQRKRSCRDAFKSNAFVAYICPRLFLCKYLRHGGRKM